MSESPSVARELATHAASLRALARDLAGRDADDLCQDTAVRALRSPPPRTTGMFGWLATVMRRLASNRHRDAERRRVREREVGANGSDMAPPAADEVEQRDLARAVSEALWALPDVYQRPLLLRYFQGLSPGAIARQLDLPVATVKSRLQRGLAQLRQGLARRSGPDWRRAIGPAFGLGGISVFWPLVSVSSMSTLGKYVVGVAAVVLVGLVVWPDAGPVAPQTPVVVAAVDSAPAITGGEVQGPTGQERTLADAAATSTVEPSPEFEFEVRASVVDAVGQAVAGAYLAIAPRGVPLALSPTASDGAGNVSMTFRARVATLPVAVGLAIQGQHTSLQEVRLAASVPTQLHFVAGPAPLPAMVQVDRAGRQVVRLPDCANGDANCLNCHRGAERANVFVVRGAFRSGLSPEPMFGDRLVEEPPVSVDARFDALLSRLDFSSETTAVPALRSTNSARRVAGRVFGVDGTPVVGARIELSTGTGRVAVSSRGDGSFEVPLLDGAQVVTIHAGGGPEGIAVRTIDLTRERFDGHDLILDPGRTLRGRVLDGDGVGLGGALVEYEAPGHPGDLATVSPDGTFAFANLPPGRGRLLVFGLAAKDRNNLLPLAVEPAVLPDSGEVVIDLRTQPPANGSLRVLVSGLDGMALADREVRIWQKSTGRGAVLLPREDGSCSANGLAAGAYHVEAFATGHGWFDLGEHYVDGSGLVDLGAVPTPAVGRVEFAFPGSIDALELWSRRDELDVRADEIGPTAKSIDLPPGRWLATWTRGGARRQHEFTLGPGAVVTVRGDD